MSEFRLFLRVFFRHWAALVTGSALIGFLAVAERVRWFVVPGWGYLVIGCLAVVRSAFLTWREEHGRAANLAKGLADCQEAANTVIIQDVQDPLYWLLAIVQRYGMRRETFRNTYAIWIGDTPISYDRSHWLYQLVKVAEGRGLLKFENKPGSGGAYRLPIESERIVNIERRRKRSLPGPPDVLVDMRGGPAEIPAPF